MGSVRALLAVSVVFAHSYGFFVLVGGKLAVQLFYMISGFLISYVLTESKTYASVKSFYINRFFRLFPMYWLVAGLTIVFWGVNSFILGKLSAPVYVYSMLDLPGRIALGITNLVIFGQDWIIFTGVKDGIFQFSTNFRDSDIAVWQGLLAPQAWTLGVELSFYLIAPFVLPRRWLIVSLLILSWMVRAFLIYIGIGRTDPWTYRFFPAELSFFLLGALSHQVWGPKLQEWGVINLWSSRITAMTVLTYCSIFSLIPHRSLDAYVLMGAFLAALPFLFYFQNSSSWDRWLGELSYPIYISHMLVVFVLRAVLSDKQADNHSAMRAGLVILITLGLSLLLNKTIGWRIEKWRNQIKGRKPV